MSSDTNKGLRIGLGIRGIIGAIVLGFFCPCVMGSMAPSNSEEICTLVVCRCLCECLANPDPSKSAAAMNAMMGMSKLIVSELEAAVSPNAEG